MRQAPRSRSWVPLAGRPSGAIIKGGLYLEKLAEVDTILLDKTGTLTYGTPEVLDVRAATETSATVLLRNAAIAESRSEHPIAKAILRKATSLAFPMKSPRHLDTRRAKVLCSQEGQEIVVGNQQFLLERGQTESSERFGTRLGNTRCS